MFEKRWASVPPQSLTSNGGTDGSLTIAFDDLFFVKQLVILSSGTQPAINLEVKRVVGNQIFLGRPNQQITDRVNISTYLVADSAAISALEQLRPTISAGEVTRAAYQEEPAVAWRSMLVGPDGKSVTADNPLPVNASVTSVQLFDKPYDTISASYPSSTVEIYETLLGGLSGVVQQTATVTYTDTTKNYIQSVVRT
jgi:hypothetical protein